MISSEQSAQPHRLLLAVANTLTIGRMCAAPLVVYLLMKAAHDDSYRWNALILLVVLQATDILDGYLARIARRDPPHPNPAGEMLDPVADKLYINSAYVTLAFTGRFYPWAAWTIFARDSVLIVGWLLQYWRTGFRQLPNRLGKAADSCQAFLLFAALLQPPETLLLAFALLTVLLTVVSTVVYAKESLDGRRREA